MYPVNLGYLTWNCLNIAAMWRRRRWAHVLAVHAASHVHHEKRIAWFYIFMRACDPFSIAIVIRLTALGATGAPLKITN